MMVDLNCDVGEGGDDAALMPFLTSANVACGGHTGDEASVQTTVRLAQQWHIAIGAHPSYPDRENFGRIEMALSAAEIAETVYRQTAELGRVAGVLTHVKPHGALYNVAAKDPVVAQAIAEGVARWSRDLVLVGLAGSRMLDVWIEMGFRTAAEGFADRRYEPDGSLRSRKYADALLTDPVDAAAQALNLAGRVQTICVHGDTPGAPAILAAVAAALRAAGVRIAATTAGSSPRS